MENFESDYVEVDMLKDLIYEINERIKNHCITLDEFLKEIKIIDDLEKKSGIVMSNSPTAKFKYDFPVVYPLVYDLKTYNCPAENKTNSIQDLKDFIDGKSCVSYPVFEGIPVTLKYFNGRLVSAVCGNIEILYRVIDFENIPLYLRNNKNINQTIIISGIATITTETLHKINEKLLEKNRFKTCYDFVYNSIFQKNIFNEKLNFMAYDYSCDIVGVDNKKRLSILTETGFDIIGSYFINDADIEITTDIIRSNFNKYPYPIKGIMIFHSDGKKNIMYDFENKYFDGIVEKIEWKMDRHGVLTPFALIDCSVNCADHENLCVKKYKINLKNVSNYLELKLGIGDRIVLEVYPCKKEDQQQICTNLTMSNKIQNLTTCPFCGSKLHLTNTYNVLELCCDNIKCKGRLSDKLNHYCETLGIKIDKDLLTRLIESEVIKRYSDIYEVIELSSHFPNRDDELIKSLEKSKNTTLSKFLYALSIPMIELGTSEDIHNVCHGKFFEFCFIMNDNPYYFNKKIDGMSKKITDSLIKYWNEFEYEIRDLIIKQNIKFVT